MIDKVSTRFSTKINKTGNQSTVSYTLSSPSEQQNGKHFSTLQESLDFHHCLSTNYLSNRGKTGKIKLPKAES